MENKSLVLDLVEWVDAAPRSYAEVMDAWRTSCPRLTVWEDAVDQDLLRRTASAEGPPQVVVTARGRNMLKAHGRQV